MRFIATFRILGLLLMIFSGTMLVPASFNLFYHDDSFSPFIAAFLITFFSGFLLWFFCRRYQAELKIRDGFMVVVLFWTVLSAFGTIPFILDKYVILSFTDAMFEAVSGLTTTGATVLTHVDKMSHAILYYRQQLHLLGGMGIIVLAIAILPMLGVGGMQLYRAETVGPIKTNKLRPRMAQTAKSLWYIYVGLVVLCVLCYWLAGMSLFDAIGEGFSTLSTGGFSPHDASFAYYHSTLIDIIGIVFMILGATNFSLHFNFIHERKLSVYWRDPEWLTYLKIIGFAALAAVIALVIMQHEHFGRAIINSLFSVVSVATTTGFTTTDFSKWPTFAPYLLMFVAMLGGCGGSTSGGIKIIRYLLLKEQGKRELQRLIHPQAIIALRLGEQNLSENVIQAIWGFVAVFILLFVILFLLLLADGLDVTTAFGALASSISNTGASIGSVHSTFEHIPNESKWILIFSMLVGRLEIFSVLVLFMPSYWRS